MKLDLEILREEPEKAWEAILDMAKDMKKVLAANEQLKEELARTKYHLAQILRRRFGTSSEYWGKGQMSLFEKTQEATTPESTSDEQPADRTDENNTPPEKPGHGRNPIPENLPRERKEHPLAPEESTCHECGKELQVLAEVISNQIEYVPPTLKVIENVTFKCVCGCKDKVVTSSMPPQPIGKGLPGPGLLAHVLVSKYCDHLPLYRQEGIFARQGADHLNRSTLSDWIGECAALLEPVYQELKQSILLSKVIQTDATTLPVLKLEEPDKEKMRSKKKKAHRGYLWVYLGDRDHPETFFEYTRHHSRDGPNHFFSNFKGRIQADAHHVFDDLFKPDSGREEVGCWAHGRRKFFDAEKTAKAPGKYALDTIGALYDIEEEIKKLSPDEKRDARQLRAKPILDQFEIWLQAQRKTILPKSPMGQAIGYALRHWKALNRYLEDGNLSIDNNASERAIKNVVIGRKNWLFAGNESGARRAAIIFSLIVTCKQNGVEPFAYLKDVLAKLAAWPESRMGELTPRNWLAKYGAAGQK